MPKYTGFVPLSLETGEKKKPGVGRIYRERKGETQEIGGLLALVECVVQSRGAPIPPL